MNDFSEETQFFDGRRAASAKISLPVLSFQMKRCNPIQIYASVG